VRQPRKNLLCLAGQDIAVTNDNDFLFPNFFFTKYDDSIYVKKWPGVSSPCNIQDNWIYEVNSQASGLLSDFTRIPLCGKFFHSVISHSAVSTRSIPTFPFFGVNLYCSLGSKLRSRTYLNIAPGTHLLDLFGRF
jgi:hypothetical protein